MTVLVRWSVLVAVIFYASAVTAREVYHTVEDDGMTNQNHDLMREVAAHRSFSVYKSLGCRLIGEPINLDDKGKAFLFTTKDACGWGTALGPMWIVHSRNGHAGKVVLDAGGYSVEGKSSVSHGMRDVEIRWGNAGFIAAQSYRFDGVRYRSVGPARKLTPAGGPDKGNKD